MATVGGTAPSQNTVNYDALLSTTLFNYKDVMYDNIFKSASFLALLKKLDGIEMINGGERIARQIMYGKGNVTNYSGYDVIDTTAVDGITQCFYEWREIGASITISRKEERQNSGESQIMDLLKQKISQAEMSIKESVLDQIITGTVSSATFVPGDNGSVATVVKDLNPLGYFFRKTKSTDPTTGGNVGNISGSTYSWWRHRTGSFSANTLTNGDFALTVSTRAGLKAALYRLYNFCVRGGDGSGPNLILMDPKMYEDYELALDANLRYSDQGMADMGFDTLKLKGGTCVWDERMPDMYNGTTAITTGSVFMVNTKYFKLYIDKETNFTTTPFVSPENQTVKTALVLFMGNTGVTNMRKHGMACDYSQSVAS